MADLFNDIINQLGKAKSELGSFKTDEQQLKRQLEQTMAVTKEAAVAQDKLNKATQDGVKADAALTSANRQAASSFKEISSNASDATDKVKRLFNTVLQGVNNTYSGLKSGNLATIFGGNQAVQFLQDAYDRMQKLNRQLLVYGGASRGFGEAARSVGSFRSQMISLGQTMSMSTDEVTALANGMMKVGWSQEQLTKALTVGGHKMNTMVAIQAAGVSAGLDYSESLDLVTDATQELGYSSEDAAKSVVGIGTAAKSAETNARLLSPVVKGLMGDFRFFGMDVEKTTSMIAAAAKGSKTAKVDMELMGNAIKGLKGASPGVGAFFGMGSREIGGGRGAVGASIQFEAALAGRGAGQASALRSVSDQLSKMSGGMGLVSRERAEKGTEAESLAYFKQRAFIEQTMGMSKDQAGKFIEVMARVERQGSVSASDAKELESLQVTQEDWQAKTYTIEDQMKKKMDEIYNRMAPYGEYLKRMVDFLGTKGLVAAGVGSAVIGPIVSAAVGAGFASFFGKLFKGSAGAVGAGGVGSTGGFTSIGKVGVGLGAATGVLQGGFAAYDAMQQGKTGSQAAKIGVSTGAGALAGGVIGALGGPIGAMIGAQLGSMAGKAFGEWIAKDKEKKVSIAKDNVTLAEENALKNLQTMKKHGITMSIEQTNQLALLESQVKLKNMKMTEDELKRMKELEDEEKAGAGAGMGKKKDKELADYREKEKAFNNAKIEEEKKLSAILLGKTRERYDEQRKNEEEAKKNAKEKGATEQEIAAITREYQKIQQEIWEDAATVKKLEGMSLGDIQKKFGIKDFMQAQALQTGGFGGMKRYLASYTNYSDIGWQSADKKVQSIRNSDAWKDMQVPVVGKASGGVALSRVIAEIGEGGKPEAIVPLDQLPNIMQSVALRNPQIGGGAGSAFASRMSGGVAGGRGGRVEPVIQEIKIRLEGEGVLAGLRKEIVLAVEDGVVKGTRKTEHAIVR